MAPPVVVLPSAAISVSSVSPEVPMRALKFAIFLLVVDPCQPGRWFAHSKP